MATLLDGERAAFGDHKGSVAAADRLPQQKRQSAVGPIGADGSLIVAAIAMGSAEIGPVSARGFLLDLLRSGRGGLDNDGRNTLRSPAALQFHLVRDPILKRGERTHAAAVKLEPQPEEQHQPDDAPAGDEDRTGELVPDARAGSQP